MLVNLSTLKTILNGFLKKINEKADKSEIVQPDWNTAEGEPGHVLNRTHYEVPEVDIFDEDITVKHNPYEEPGRGYFYTFKNELSLESGKQYRLTYDCGAACSTIIFIAPEDGNQCYFNSDNSTSANSFVQGSISKTSFVLDYPTSTNGRLTITSLGELKTLDPKYLPDSIKARPDWNQNDETASDYVKNRPFYEGIVETIYVEEQEITLTEGSDGNLHSNTQAVRFGDIQYLLTLWTDASEGTIFTVYYNGVAYTCATALTSVGWGLGNFSLYGSSKENSGEPFFILHGGNCRIYTTEDAESCTLKITKPSPIIHTLDPKYLPDSAAHIETGASVGQTIVVKAVDENGKPTEWEAADLPDSIARHPDWNQNDETALDYVKNRTHWTGTAVEQKTEAIYLDCLSSNGGSKIVSVSQSFIDGLMTSPDSVIVCKDVSADSLEQTHKIVVIDDTTFGFVRLSDNYTEYLKGYIGKNSSGEPTVYVTDRGGNWGHCNIAVTYDIEVEEIHTIDPKYLPDSVKARPDWNQNDPTAPDYIKNRPFYESSGLDSETREFTDMLEDAEFAALLYANRQTAQYIIDGVQYTFKNDEQPPEGYGWNLGTANAPDMFVAGMDGVIYLLGNISITVNYEEETIHKIDPKYLPDSVKTQPDWNAAENEPGYIKNRPFYGNIETIEVNETCNVGGFSSGYGEAKELGNLLKSDNDLSNVVVTIKGTEYALVYNDDRGWWDLKDGGNYSVEIDSTGTYILASYLSDGTVSGTATFTGYYKTGEIKQLDPKYLPDSAKSDWNQNDPTAPDYIKNRPFYEETAETVLFKEHTAIFVADEPYQLPPPVTPIDFSPDNPLFNGTTLRIVWDGVAYDCVTVDGLAGNGKPLGIPNLGNGEPFFFDFETFYVYEGGEHTYSVSIVEETIHKLDAKYLPEYDAVITVNEVDNNRVPTLVSGSNADIIAKLKHGDVPRVLVKHKVISPDGIVHIAVEHPLVHAEFENEQATEGVVLIMSNFSSNLAILPNNEVMLG